MRINNPETNRFLITDGNQIIRFSYEQFTGWDMQADLFKFMGWDNVPATAIILGVFGVVHPDDGGDPLPLNVDKETGTVNAGILNWYATGMDMFRLPGGTFDSGDYSDDQVLRITCVVTYIDGS